MPEEAAAALIEAPAETSSAAAESGAPETAAGSPGEPPSPQGGEGSLEEGAEFRANELYRAVKEQLRSLDPKHNQAIRKAIFEAEKLRERIGGDLKG